MVYFIVTIHRVPGRPEGSYEEYIREVKPIVERYGGRYLVRPDKVVSLQETWQPDRVIVIEWDTREQLDACFSSAEYRAIAGKREQAVDSRALIVDAAVQEEPGGGKKQDGGTNRDCGDIL